MGLSISLAFILIFSNYFFTEDVSVKNPIIDIFNVNFLDNYLAGDAESYNDIPRFTKIVIGLEVLSENNNIILGQEYGAFKGGTTLALTPFAENYQWLISGSRSYIFYLLVSGGLTLIFLILFLIIGEIIRKRGFENYETGLLRFITSIFFILLFYNDAFRNPAFLIIFIYLLFFSKYYQRFIS
jgi:hypothetical protein